MRNERQDGQLDDEEFMAIYRRWQADFHAAAAKGESPPEFRTYLKDRTKWTTQN